MNAPTTAPLTVDQFLEWAAANPDTKCELIDGVIVPKNSGEPFGMAPKTKLQARVKALVVFCLEEAIRASGRPCNVYPDGPGVRVGERHLFIPDVIVECGAGEPDRALLVDEPTVAVEVVSPSNRAPEIERRKLAYVGLPTLVHYLVLDPDTRTIERHSKGPDGATTGTVHTEGTVTLDPPGLTLDVPALFP